MVIAIISVIASVLPFAYAIVTTFNVHSGVKVGDETVAAELIFHNTTTPLNELTFTDTGTDRRPIIDLRGHEPQGAVLIFNQTLLGGSNGWLVLSEFEPTVSGPASDLYFAANDTLKLGGSSDGQVIIFFPTQGPAGSTLPLLIVPVVMAFFARKIPIALIMAVTLVVVLVVGLYG